jgi:RNA polymerase primary sigma factor
MSDYANDFNTTVRTYYKELKHCNPISREREKSLIKKAKNNNLHAKNEILSSNLKFVFDVAKRYKGCGVSLPDLISEGNMGLTKAIDKFDESRDVKFISYAVWWIRQSIQDFIKRRQTSTSIEVSDELNSIVCENAVEDNEDEVIRKKEVVLSNEEDEREREIEENQRKLIKKLLVKLNDREKLILENYFGLDNKEEMTLEEIGVILNISKERVRQIKEKSLRKLRSEVLLISELGDIYK